MKPRRLALILPTLLPLLVCASDVPPAPGALTDRWKGTATLKVEDGPVLTEIVLTLIETDGAFSGALECPSDVCDTAADVSGSRIDETTVAIGGTLRSAFLLLEGVADGDTISGTSHDRGHEDTWLVARAD